jgi:hypothetical protein
METQSASRSPRAREAVTRISPAPLESSTRPKAIHLSAPDALQRMVVTGAALVADTDARIGGCRPSA